MKRVPVRLRLTLWFTAVLAAILVVFSVVLVQSLSWQLRENFDSNLEVRSDLLQASLQAGDPTAIPDIDDDILIALFAADGTVSYQPHDADERGRIDDFSTTDQERLFAALQAAANGDDATITVEWDGEPIRVVVAPLKSRDGQSNPYKATAIGESLEELNQTLAIIKRVLIIASVAALAASLVAGYFLTAQTLKPIRKITSLAASISEHDLNTRLDLNLPRDELGDLQQTLNAMLDRIDNAFERQKRFTSDAAHELRTPISLLRGEVDVVLERERSSDEYRKTLGEMGVTLDRMGGLTASLLTLARLDAQHYVSISETFQLDETLNSVLETYRPIIEAQGIELVSDLKPVVIVGDLDVVVRVAVNLLDNAIAATPSSGQIIVSCSMGDGEAVMSVSDNGVGIAKADQPHIFDRFYRPDSSRSRSQGGNGLGLSICSTLLQANSASISVESDVGIGTTFTVRLPVSTM